MFTITESDVQSVLLDFGIEAPCASFCELQRYRYEKDDPASRQVRLIVRADLENGASFVVRFKNEDDAPMELIEAQSRFAALLCAHGIETPKACTSEGRYARRYRINGYDVTVTVEPFVTGELKAVDAETAEATGRLLAGTHNVAEITDSHVNSDVLFDPFKRNDLFSFEDFTAHEAELLAIDGALYHRIVQEHARLVQRLAPFAEEPRYAVQGDISDCNLYRTQDGRLGVFDFNRCGDNNLFFDAGMQAIFEARLMDYPAELAGRQEPVILSAFLNGYQQVRPFTPEQKAAFPYLYALVSAFWLADIRWDENSLINALASGDAAAAHAWMKEIYRREMTLLPMPEQPCAIER